MLEGGFLSNGLSGIIINYDSGFFPFGSIFFDFTNYDYTEFLVYTIIPVLLYYSYWLRSKVNSDNEIASNFNNGRVCPKCSSNIPSDSNFCTNCGIKII